MLSMEFGSDKSIHVCGDSGEEAFLALVRIQLDLYEDISYKITWQGGNFFLDVFSTFYPPSDLLDKMGRYIAGEVSKCGGNLIPD